MFGFSFSNGLLSWGECDPMDSLASYGFSDGSSSDKEETITAPQRPNSYSVPLPPEEDDNDDTITIEEDRNTSSCFSCAFPLPPAAVFCPKCGAKQEENQSDSEDVQGEQKKKKKKGKEKKRAKKAKTQRVLLPSAAALLASLPDSLLGRPENIILSGGLPATDPEGTKYNAVAPPSNGSLNQVSDEEKFRLRAALPLDKLRAAQAAQLKAFSSRRPKEPSKELPSLASSVSSSPMGSSLMFAPRQIGGKVNVSTEDLEGMGMLGKRQRGP